MMKDLIKTLRSLTDELIEFNKWIEENESDGGENPEPLEENAKNE